MGNDSLVPSSIHEVAAALRRGDRDTAQKLLAQGRARFAPASILESAQAMMRLRRWADAAWLFDQTPGLDGAAQLKRCLSRNFASLQQHRPALYDLLLSLPASAQYGIGASASGKPTVIFRTVEGRNISLSPGNDPLAALVQARTIIRNACNACQPIALCGAGDGYLLHHLAHHSPAAFMDMAQLVHLIEPDAQVVLQCLMIHDYSGPNGPIEQPRFQWFVGPNWEAALRQALFSDLMLGCPAMTIGQGLQTKLITDALQHIAEQIGTGDVQTREQLETYYSNYESARFPQRSDAREKPHVLLLTTRFSTVLQHSTRDAAEAFDRLGWDAHVVIEPTTHHRIFRHAIRHALAQFKPDLVFQIDHLRHEHQDLVPANLPFVCWVQDHLPNLMNESAGPRITSRDFVLSDTAPTYVNSFGYPARQFIAMPKLTGAKVTAPTPTRTGAGDDITFVSNASADPQVLLDDKAKEMAGAGPARDVLLQCGRSAIDIFQAGRALSTIGDVRDLVHRVQVQFDVNLDESIALQLIRWLSHPFIDALYRQQAIRWAAATADELGLSLSLYGKGWDHHPEFSRYARGPVAYGADLQALTRRSVINLQVVPYFCLHQRLLDGICAGGFFLVRQHTSDVAPAALLQMLQTCCPEWARAVAQARDLIPANRRPEFDRLVWRARRCFASTGAEDPIEMIRIWQEAQMLTSGDGVLPRLDEVSFTSAAEFRTRVETFLRNPASRSEIVVAQQQSISGRLTYDAGMARLIRRMGELLADTSDEFIGVPIPLYIGQAA